MNPNPFIPYGRQFIDEDDIQAVVEVLRSDWLTTGPKVEEFENAVAEQTGARYAVAVNSGTAALHCAMYAIGILQGDEVVVPAMTFAATANCVVYQGGTPIFADVDPDTLLIDPADVKIKITDRTKAIIAVDYAGQPCDYDRLKKIAKEHELFIVDDACHALGAKYKGRKIGSVADLTVFSFHPVKHITTGEGGMIVTDDENLANRMRIFRNHGINSNFREREATGSWYYEMIDLGYNYRITDIQCAIGISQLKKLERFLKRRREVAAKYGDAFAGMPGIEPLRLRSDVLPAKQAVGNATHSSNLYTRNPAPSLHAYHLYGIQLDTESLNCKRTEIFIKLRAEGIGVNVHYIPVHLHPFFQKKFGTKHNLCPVAENAYERIISLPLNPLMTDNDVGKVIESVEKIVLTSEQS